MKKFLTVCLAMIFISQAGFAQAAKVVFVEAGGPGLASFNFDTRFANKQDGFGGRIGVGGFNLDGEGAVFIPITLNYIVSKDKNNYFELGAGATLVPVSSAIDAGPFSGTSGHLNFGYRYQPLNGGIFFRVTLNPIFGQSFFWPYYGGLSLGYKF